MNKELSEMQPDELKLWLESKFEYRWSNRDLIILSQILFDEYQISKHQAKPCRTDREFLTKMLIRGKIQNGISLED